MKSATDTSGIFELESKVISSESSSMSRNRSMNVSHASAPDGADLCPVGSKRCAAVMRRFAAEERG